MADLLGILMVLAAFIAVLGGFVWFAARIRRRGLGGAVMGPLDEVYNPAAHRARFDIEVQHERLGQPSEGSETGDSMKRR